MAVGVCFSCKKTVDVADPISRRDECPHCGEDVHVCLNCVNFGEHLSNQCKEDLAESVREKDRSNFCDYFKFSDAQSDGSSKRDDLLAAAEALFKR